MMISAHALPRPAVTILLNEAPRRAMESHALAHRDREVAGFLVGRRPEKQPDGYYVVEVSDYVPAAHSPRRHGSVTITADIWHYAHGVMHQRHPDHLTVIVGWARTCPGCGLFLSAHDRYLHGAFFKQPWQVAAVIDPLARAAGFFAWDAAREGVGRHEFVWGWG